MLSSSELIAAFTALSTSAVSTKMQKVNKAYKNQFFFFQIESNWSLLNHILKNSTLIKQ